MHIEYYYVMDNVSVLFPPITVITRNRPAKLLRSALHNFHRDASGPPPVTIFGAGTGVFIAGRQRLQLTTNNVQLSDSGGQSVAWSMLPGGGPQSNAVSDRD